MSLFGSIVEKIIHYAGSALTPAAHADTPAAGAPAPATPGAAPTAAPTAPAPSAGGGAGGSIQSVDVGEVLSKLAAQKNQSLNWQSSIVDLLKLLDLDSSLEARKSLGQELGVHAGADGSAEQNIALHRAVMQKLAANGGKVPDDLRN
ncbi:DUF3597 family protein [Rhizosaccharibacter radicis]|uniref:DUF3597 domain-containing protein n=1 Tax=Rhizosaccharibacter radicis TaxID=2782605 RepID=A0ABT1VZ35_9PROT|nr:DUF3597 domain-containing protein [Acetobacteraceae bacterium KSS12]